MMKLPNSTALWTKLFDTMYRYGLLVTRLQSENQDLKKEIRSLRRKLKKEKNA